METSQSGKHLYYTLEDLKSICDRCQCGYYGDFIYRDCEYCRLPLALNLLKTYAKKLDYLETRDEDDGR